MIILNDLSTEQAIEIMNKLNKENEKFEKANPQFKKDTSNLAQTAQEIEYYENLYSSLECGLFEYSQKDFHFKRADAYSIQAIFRNNWEKFKLDNYCSSFVTPHIDEEIQKMLTCQDSSLGYAIYECDHCHETICVPFTCKSRFCNTCAIKYQQQRALEVSRKLIRCKHRHMVFTIPQELRPYFLKYRHLLDVLFKAVEECILYFFHQRAPLKKFKPGIVSVLHTFGRDLKWNPHIHCLVTEGASSDKKVCPNGNIWINVTHFNYEFFRKSFRKSLLDNLKIALKPLLTKKDFSNFKKLVDSFYKNYKYGFYVRAKPFDGNSTDNAVKYLLRYFNRPPMAQSRILYYDGSYVVFYYQRHEDNMFVIEKVPVFEFIARLIVHIPEKHFKLLRYAGFYSSHKCTHFDKLSKKLSEKQYIFKRKLLKWSTNIEITFHYAPLKCPICSKTMTFATLSIANSS